MSLYCLVSLASCLSRVNSLHGQVSLRSVRRDNSSSLYCLIITAIKLVPRLHERDSMGWPTAMAADVDGKCVTTGNH